jgi:hypothetical protein
MMCMMLANRGLFSEIGKCLQFAFCVDLRWSGLRVRQDVEERLSKIEADLLCELIGVS